MNAKKILLIEDNPEMRENTAEILELANYEVTTATNGKEGVKLAHNQQPDLIICDITVSYTHLDVYKRQVLVMNYFSPLIIISTLKNDFISLYPRPYEQLPLRGYVRAHRAGFAHPSGK